MELVSLTISLFGEYHSFFSMFVPFIERYSSIIVTSRSFQNKRIFSKGANAHPSLNIFYHCLSRLSEMRCEIKTELSMLIRKLTILYQMKTFRFTFLDICLFSQNTSNLRKQVNFLTNIYGSKFI